MYTRILVPLDGSKTAEEILPYARSLTSKLKIPAELLGIVDVVETGLHFPSEKAHLVTSVVDSAMQSSARYLKGIAATFSDVDVTCTVEDGVAADIIIDKAAAEPGTLITMTAQGRSGIHRWLLGSVAEKVLRGGTNPLLMIRANEQAKTEGEGLLKSIVVPLDGSELAETVLPHVTTLANSLVCEIILLRVYRVPYTAVVPVAGYYPTIDYNLIDSFREEATSYLDNKAEALRESGAGKVSCVAREGLAADEIISLARQTPGSLIAMCSHGRSGVRRWVLGSVTETVARHSTDPVLVIRAQAESHAGDRLSAGGKLRENRVTTQIPVE